MQPHPLLRAPDVAGKWTLTFLASGLVAVGVAFAWWSWEAYRPYQLVSDLNDRHRERLELKGKVLLLDEALAASARLRVLTGEPRWEERHRRAQSELAAAVAAAGIRETAEAHARRLLTEQRAFELAAAGRVREAAELLDSPEHRREREAYAKSMARFAGGLQLAFEDDLARERLKTLGSVAGAAVFLALIIWGLVHLLRSLHRTRTMLLAELEGARCIGQALQKAHDKLEARVRERTAELKKTEEELRQSQKMEAVGRLAGGVAHDFNNMLCAILGFSHLAEMELGAEHPVASSLAEIRRAGERATALTRQLLAFSRKQVLQPRVIDLNRTISDMEVMLTRLIGEHIRMEKVLDRDLGRVKADPGQIQQVIMNLVINARDAMAKGGKLTLETANAELDATFRVRDDAFVPGSYVTLTVRDTGCGMDAATEAHLFEPFFTTKPRGQGTGLGLSTAYGIVRQSGGYIAVESAPGRGTSFTIALPRIEEEADSTTQILKTQDLRMAGVETILLVEDEDLVRSLARDVLRGQGYTVLEAVNGREALDVMGRHRGAVDLVLTDVVMPEMGGLELLHEARRRRPSLKFVLMSGYTDDAGVHIGVEAREIPFLQKPFTAETLVRKVRASLDRQPKDARALAR